MKPQSQWRKFWLVLLCGILITAVFLASVVALLWHNRTGLMEDQVRNLIAKQGYDISLDIRSLSLSRAVVDNITMRKDGHTFFKAEHLNVEYDLGKRTAQRLELYKPYIDIEFDRHGQIKSRWMMAGSDSGQKLLLPPNGLLIEAGIVNWRLVQDAGQILGAGMADVSADITSETRWSANINGENADFHSDLLRGSISQNLFIETADGQSFQVFGSASAQNLATTLLPLEKFQTKSMETQFKLNIVRPHTPNTNKQPTISGWNHARFLGISLPDYQAENLGLKLDQLRLDAQGQFSTNWQLDGAGMQMRNPEMRLNLSDRLTADSAMANIPIAQYFTPTLKAKANRLLSGFDATGQGKLSISKLGYEIELQHPLHIQSDAQDIHLSSNQEPYLRYDAARQIITMQTDMDWTGVQSLKLTDFDMTAKSFSGTKIDALRTMNTHVNSHKNWHLNHKGDDVRLSPFDIDFTYNEDGSGLRTIYIDGGIDYDGPVPGGLVDGLRADGAMHVQLRGNDFTLGYTPSAPLQLVSFTNPSGWTTQGLNFTLKPTKNLLSRTARANILHTTLLDVSTQLIDPDDLRHLEAKFTQLDVQTDFTTNPQHWQVSATDTDIRSEDFPAPGTHIVAPHAKLNVFQSQDGDMTFDIQSPDTRVDTNNAKINQLNIHLSGDPDDIALDYQAGRVAMVGGAVPILPMRGTAQLKSGVLTGHAITNLPRTKNTPIDIHYRSEAGQGSAKIQVPKILFAPRGLQPQQLVPVLRGKLADVTGEVAAEFDFSFGGGKPVQSKGWADLKDLNIGTLVGPISGLNAKLTFTSIFPLSTDGVQTVTLSGFDPGFPLNDGRIQFEIVPDGIQIHQALWPIKNVTGLNAHNDMSEDGKPELGRIFLSPSLWRFGNVENKVVVNVENVGLSTMLAGIGKDKLSASGQVYGTLPASIKGVDVVIDDGVLAVKDGGLIRYKSAATDTAAQGNETAEHAFKALENFQYKQLEAHIDGPIDGPMTLKIVFDGQNPEVLDGQTFLFNTMVKGELTNITRNMAGAFSNEENLSRILEIKASEAADQP